MISLAPTTQLPEPIVFTDEAAALRPVTSSLSAREEVRLHLLARDLVHYEPELSLLLRDLGMAQLSAELVEA